MSGFNRNNWSDSKDHSGADKAILEKVWQERTRNSMGVCMLCNRCGGSSTSSCSCARTKFFNSVTDSDMDKYRQEAISNRREELIKRISSLTDQLSRAQDELNEHMLLSRKKS
jgi:hypothetical protein